MFYLPFLLFLISLVVFEDSGSSGNDGFSFRQGGKGVRKERQSDA